jgi:hypothetical protein
MISLAAYGYEEYFDISYDSWGTGRPDNIPETEVIIMGNCQCP